MTDSGRIRETHYVLATNLAFLTMANEALRHTLVMDDDPVIPEAEFKHVKQQLEVWLTRYHEHITSMGE